MGSFKAWLGREPKLVRTNRDEMICLAWILGTGLIMYVIFPLALVSLRG